MIQINSKDLVLQDMDRCKKIQPIMERFGIEPDACFYRQYDGNVIFDEDYACFIGDKDGYYPTYRQDKLALALPDWETGTDAKYSPIRMAGFDYPLEHGNSIPILRINDLLRKAVLTRGQPQLEATADLLILLDKEGLL